MFWTERGGMRMLLSRPHFRRVRSLGKFSPTMPSTMNVRRQI